MVTYAGGVGVCNRWDHSIVGQCDLMETKVATDSNNRNDFPVFLNVIGQQRHTCSLYSPMITPYKYPFNKKNYLLKHKTMNITSSMTSRAQS